MPTSWSVNEAYQALTSFAPNPMQKEVWQKLVDDEEGGLLLLAPTGSGKTEAVTVPGLALDRRIFVILPARSLVDDQIGRFEEMLKRASSADPTRPYALIVDTGAQSTRRIWHKGKSVGQPQRRHLYQGDIIVTTLDKFLYRFFGFGEQGKSYTFPLHIRYGLRPTLYCFDEAHSYDAVAWTNFRLLLRTLYEKGLDVVAMTATMPSAFADELDFLTPLDWINGSNRARLDAFSGQGRPRRTLTFHPVPSSEVVEKLIALGKQHLSPQRRVILCVESVRDAVAVFQALNGRASDQVLLYHGRLTAPRRQQVYADLKSREAEKRGYLLVTTSAIEVGCDLDAHVLITQLTNPEQLLQRVGRCNRRGKILDAQVIVVGQEIPSYLTTLTTEQQAAYVKTLQAQNGKLLDTTAIQAHIAKEPNPDYRVEIAFQMLYEYVYEAATVNKGLHDKGLVITRSWEPSITLCTGIESENQLLNPVQVSLERCATSDAETLTPGCTVYVRTFGFGDQERRPRLEPLSGGYRCAYLSDLIARVPDKFYKEEIGYAELPRLVCFGGQQGYQKKLFIPLDGGKRAWLWYIAPLEAEIEDQETDADDEEQDE